jgi:ribosome-associated protein
MAAVIQAQLEPSDLADRVVDLLSGRQAEDVVLLDISQVSSFTDFFVVATAQNPRHMNSLIDAFDKELPNQGVKPLHIEGDAASGWVLVDLGAVIAHLFTEDDRRRYNLEGLWSRSGVPAVRFQ